MTADRARIIPIAAIVLSLVLFAVGVFAVNITDMAFIWRFYIVGCLAYALYAAIYDATEALYNDN